MIAVLFVFCCLFFLRRKISTRLLIELCAAASIAAFILGVFYIEDNLSFSDLIFIIYFISSSFFLVTWFLVHKIGQMK